MKSIGKPSITKALGKFTIWMAAIALVGFSIGTAVGFRSPAQAQATTSYDELRVFAEVLALIQNYYVEEKTTKELAVGAIKGLLKTLDPHSSYMDTEVYNSRKEETEGKFGGLGIEITVMDNFIGIVAPIEDTPAERAGLQSGDLIIKIDDASTKDMYLVDAVKKMRGKVGTKVKITIFRESANKTFDVDITRALIQIRSVKGDMIDGETGYMRIVTFAQKTSQEANEKLDEMKKKGMKKLVLDLRNNPGGLLKQAVDISDLFLEKGQIIVSTRGRTPDQNSEFKSNGWGGYSDLPMVIMINAGSASASEIVAGALKDHHRGVVVGQRSFGKGSVQTIRQLSDGSGLSLTTARYYTPSDKLIHGIGIEPDIEVKLIVTDESGEQVDLPEPIREKDLMERFNGEHDMPLEMPEPKKNGKNGKNGNDKSDSKKESKSSIKDKTKIFDLEKDNQLQKALEVLKQIDTPIIEKVPGVPAAT